MKHTDFVRKQLRSERPVDVSAAGIAVTLALPTREVQIVREAAALRCEAVARLDHRTPAAQRRTRGIKALIRCARFAAELILPREPRIDFALCAVLVRIRKAKTHTIRVHRAEVVVVGAHT